MTQETSLRRLVLWIWGPLMLLGIGSIGAAQSAPPTYFGSSVCAIGDLDGDGAVDLAVGAPGRLDELGSVWVLSSAKGVVLQRWPGRSKGGRFGSTLCALLDLDGDGVDEVLVGAPSADRAKGHVYVISGGTGSVLALMRGKEANERFGSSIVSLGPLDAQDHPAWAAGAPGAEGGGTVRIFTGTRSEPLRVLSSDQNSGDFGHSLAVLPEEQGPGLLAVGAPKADVDGIWRVGLVRVFSLDSGEQVSEFLGDSERHEFGFAVSSAGDLDGDGHDDLLVGSGRRSLGGHHFDGYVRVLSIETGEILWTLDSDPGGDALGHSLCALGDLDADGVPDLAASAPNATVVDPDIGPINGGVVQIVSGVSGKIIRTIGVTPEDNQSRWPETDEYYWGPGPRLFGTFLSPCPDLDGDGLTDLLIGTDDCFGSAEVRIYSGSRGTLLRRFIEWEYLRFGPFDPSRR